MSELPHPPTISREEVLRRQDAVRQQLAPRGLDALLVIGRSFYERPGDLAYLTNHFPPFPTAVFGGPAQGLGHGVLVLPQEGPPVLLIDHPSYWKDLVAVDDVRAGSDVVGAIIGGLSALPSHARVGVTPPELLPWPVAEQIKARFPQLLLEAAGDVLAELRSHKSPAELALLRQASAVAGAGLAAAVDAIRPGATEAGVSAQGTAAALASGADFVRYFRVHSGPFSSWGSRWPQATSRVLEEGDLVAMDVIGAVGGYQFDVNRTASCGQLRETQRALCEAVYEATVRCVESARSGVTVEALVQVAADAFAPTPFAASFGGAVGHAIGLETVELPYLRRGVEATLSGGEVLCIEPGLFIHGVGGCSIEQIVAVQESGAPELLTTFPARIWT